METGGGSQERGAVLAGVEAQALAYADQAASLSLREACFRAGRLRALIQMATGGGKTVIAAIDAASQLIPHGGRAAQCAPAHC